MASSTMLMLVFQGFLLAPQVSALSVFTDDAIRLHEHQHHTVSMDGKGHMQAKPQQHGHGLVRADADEAPAKAKSEVQKQFPFYHTTHEIRAEALRLSKACNGRLTLKTIKDSGVDIDVVTVKKAEAKPVNKAFLLFGEHARELISPESGIYFLRALCGDVALEIPAMVGFLKEKSTAEQALEDSEFMMVLNSNPNSRKKVEGGSYCLRVNEKGIDLNRNWDEHFAQGQGGETAAGAEPFSEPETRIVKDLVTEFAPTTFLTVHSGTRGMYMPWAYDGQHMATTNKKPMMDVLMALDKDHCQCPFGAAGAEVGYPCPGTCLDYAYAKLNTPFAYAFEIYVSGGGSDLKRRWDEKMKSGGNALLEKGHNLAHPHFRDFFDQYHSDFVGNQSASLLAQQGGALNADAAVEGMDNDGCLTMFNPTDEDEYKKVIANWAQTYFQMSSAIAQKLRSGEVTSHPKVAEPADFGPV